MDVTDSSKKRPRDPSVQSEDENLLVESKKSKSSTPESLSPSTFNSTASHSSSKSTSLPKSASLIPCSNANVPTPLSSNLVTTPVPISDKSISKQTSPTQRMSPLLKKTPSPKEEKSPHVQSEHACSPAHPKTPFLNNQHNDKVQKPNSLSPIKNYGFMSFANSAGQNPFYNFSTFQNPESTSIFSHSSPQTFSSTPSFSWNSTPSKKGKVFDTSTKKEKKKNTDDDNNDDDQEGDDDNEDEDDEWEQEETVEATGGNPSQIREYENEFTSVQSTKFSAILPIETGEENEKVKYSVRAKLYICENEGFKEKGIGTLKLNVNELENGQQKARLVMRSDNVYKILLNCNLIPGMTCMVTDSFVRFVAIENSTFTIYLFKLTNAKYAEELAESILAFTSSPDPQSTQIDNSPS
ncbi:hypothetical protein HMI54_004199 [Coelomomyces lativittatus]|nr:hypothetical protein HMI56_001008 [Coelomomyces lativittatus]KAJ1517769.1 hypothetical protein HMI54_004199 [Coelomomyces lativittatus]KAJ1518433.1 hypothetical protein HMI55_002050 [Coelomomyces lativittatus]